MYKLLTHYESDRMKDMSVSEIKKSFLSQGKETIFNESIYSSALQQGIDYIRQHQVLKGTSKRDLQRTIENIQNKCAKAAIHVFRQQVEAFFTKYEKPPHDPDVICAINEVVKSFEKNERLYIRGRIHQPLFVQFLKSNNLQDSDVY